MMRANTVRPHWSSCRTSSWMSGSSPRMTGS